MHETMAGRSILAGEGRSNALEVDAVAAIAKLLPTDATYNSL